MSSQIGLVVFLLITFAVFSFFVFALLRARQKRRAEFQEPEAKNFEKNLEPEKESPPLEKLPALVEPVVTTPVVVDEHLTLGLRRTHDSLLGRLGSLFSDKQIPSDLVDRVEEVLLTSDVGIRTTQALMGEVRQQLSRHELKDQQTLFSMLETRIREVLMQTVTSHWQLVNSKPAVVLMVGVNGVGKTTTIGKLAAHFRSEGKQVMVAAGDTFRAAAVEQLKIWAQRTGCAFYSGATGKDPASVIFEACQQAQKENVDVLLADTAGRLHTKSDLMEELKKVKRVVGKVIANAPHETFLVLDATTGQNALVQARQFHEAIGLSGIVLTKLDGTAKGGVVVAIASELNIPIRFVGVGEKIDDLRLFNPEQFAHALFAAT